MATTDTRSGHRWDDYRPEDRLRARMGVFRRRVEQSRRIVAAWLPQVERPYVAVSGGKDSVAMLHLVQGVAREEDRPLLPVLWHDSGVEWPGVPEMFERLHGAGLIGELVTVRPEVDVLELKHRQEAGELSAAVKDRLALFDPIRRAVAARGFDGYALGLRRGESFGREMDRRRHGSLWRTRDGLLRCCPLADWEWQDVYAYGCLHGLPLHPIYSAPLLGLEHRGRIRLSWWASTDHRRHGELAWLRHNYPDLWERLTAAVPQVRGYA